ncbi:MAG: hypothetical protein JW808_07880, partial [Victivallales bacterium]|nr:hypothetical protein [Victivallales bacterium]
MLVIYARRVLRVAVLLGVSLACLSPVFSQGRREPDASRKASWQAVIQAENELRHESSRKAAEKALWRLSSRAQSSSPDPSACRALALLSRTSRDAVGYGITRRETLLPPPAFLRAALSPDSAAKSRDIAKISKALEQFEEYSLVAGWDYKIPGRHSNPALLPFVEAAYLKALDSSFSNTSEGLREALKMLSYAEPRTQGIDRAEALCQLGELMREIKEFRRSETY